MFLSRDITINRLVLSVYESQTILTALLTLLLVMVTMLPLAFGSCSVQRPLSLEVPLPDVLCKRNPV